VINVPNQPRRLLPRWHSPKVSSRRAETHSLSESSSLPGAAGPQFHELRGDWQKHHDAAHAADLVSAGIASGLRSQVEDAARFLLTPESGASVLARAVAAQALAETQGIVPEHPDEDHADPAVISARIAAGRARLRDEPRNSLLWVEQSRQYTLRGQRDAAVRAMEIALALAPEHRVVLRSGARLWAHFGEPDRAHQILTRSQRAAEDPWIVASELATALLAEQRPRFVKVAREMLGRGGFLPVHTTELASSLASLELHAGQSRRAKRLFNASLQAPNDNSLAQAEWAADHVRLDDLERHLEEVPNSFEARARAAAAEGQHDRAIADGWNWFLDEPFAGLPPVFGSYHAAMAREYGIGVEFAQRGLVANPRSYLLRNNLAFCYAKLGETELASKQLREIDVSELDDSARATVVATEGLVAFRGGALAHGRERYFTAIRLAPDNRTKAIALIMLAVEEAGANQEEASATAELAARTAEASLGPGDRDWIEHLTEIPSLEAAVGKARRRRLRRRSLPSGSR
jgi:tetratricopeptide (TPR) repeat protein